MGILEDRENAQNSLKITLFFVLKMDLKYCFCNKNLILKLFFWFVLARAFPDILEKMNKNNFVALLFFVEYFFLDEQKFLKCLFRQRNFFVRFKWKTTFSSRPNTLFFFLKTALVSGSYKTLTIRFSLKSCSFWKNFLKSGAWEFNIR